MIILQFMTIIILLIMLLNNVKSNKELKNSMKSQEERLKAVVDAVAEVKTQLSSANEQLAAIREKNENPAIEDELSELENTLGLAAAAVELPAENTESVSEETGDDVEDAEDVEQPV